MAGLRFTDLQSRPLEFLDFTSLTLNEFQQLVPPFKTAGSLVFPGGRNCSNLNKLCLHVYVSKC